MSRTDVRIEENHFKISLVELFLKKFDDLNDL
jgi:hypothetical protein